MRLPRMQEAQCYLISQGLLNRHHEQYRFSDGSKAWPGAIIERAVKEGWRAPRAPRNGEEITTRSKPSLPRAQPKPVVATPRKSSPRAVCVRKDRDEHNVPIDVEKVRELILERFGSLAAATRAGNLGKETLYKILRRGYCARYITPQRLARLLRVQVWDILPGGENDSHR